MHKDIYTVTFYNSKNQNQPLILSINSGMGELWSIQTMEHYMYSQKKWGEILWPKWKEVKWYFISLNAKRKLQNHRYEIPHQTIKLTTKKPKTLHVWVLVIYLEKCLEDSECIHQTVISWEWEELSLV